MAKKWSEVANSVEFMALSPDQKEIARNQYFEQVVAPRVPQEELSSVRSHFDAETKIADFPAMQADRSALSGLTREQRQAQIAAADSALNLQGRTESIAKQEHIGRSMALGGRAMIEGLASVPDILVSPLVQQVNRVLPERYQQKDIRGTAVAALDAMGVPHPASSQERIASDITSGIAGASTGVGAGRLLSTSTNPLLARVGQVLSDSPGLQILSGASGSGGGGIAREAGAGVGGQVAASVAGGLSAGGTAAGIRTAEDAVRVMASSSSAAERRAAQDLLKQVAQARASDAGQAAARSVEQVAPNLQYTPSKVPGVVRTYGEGTLDPAAMALENRLRNQFPDIFAPRDKLNNAARMRGLEKIAGTQQKRDLVEGVRNSIASNARNEAMRAGPVDISGTVSKLDDAIAGAEGRTAVEGALKHLRGKLVKETTADGVTTSSPEDRIRVLENIRKDIGDMLEGKFSADTNKALAGSRELIAIRDSLNKEIGQQVPAFNTYLNTYRRLSRPLNRMDIGQELMNRAGNSTDAQTGYRQLTADKFGRAYNDLDALAAKATGFKKARADQILSRRDLDSLAALNDDFSRIYSRDTTVPKGSPTAGLLARGVGGLADMAISKVPIVGTKLQGLSRLADQTLDSQTKEKMAYLMANPEEMQRVMRSLPAKDADALRKAATQIAYASNIATAENAGGAQGLLGDAGGLFQGGAAESRSLLAPGFVPNP